MNSPDGSLNVTLQVAVASTEVPDHIDCAAWIEAALVTGKHPAAGTVTVRLVDEQDSAQLNSTYRHKAGPTNVLAFPGPGRDFPGPDTTAELGDLVICWPVTCHEAAEQGKTALNHLTHLVVHGTLHLIGYDHQQVDEAEHMEQLEIRALNQLGIANPYA